MLLRFIRPQSQKAAARVALCVYRSDFSKTLVIPVQKSSFETARAWVLLVSEKQLQLQSWIKMLIRASCQLHIIIATKNRSSSKSNQIWKLEFKIFSMVSQQYALKRLFRLFHNLMYAAYKSQTPIYANPQISQKSQFHKVHKTI